MPRPTNALIVDDEAHVRMYLRLLLRELGIATTWEAADGAQAITLIGEHWPELILLDLNMPVMGGLEVLAEVQRAAPDIPVIVVSSQTAMKSVAESVRLGAVGYLLKHSPKDIALRTLRETLDLIERGESAEETPGPTGDAT